jgi:hypothetical protein
METEKYLKSVLKSQTLALDSQELKDLQQHRADMEEVIREHFKECSPTIRYGGSKAKGTMIRESYDLDIISYFPHDDTAAGETLEEIYKNVQKALSGKYLVEPKASALRLKARDPENYGVDFHIDVVPGRFTDDSKTDAFLYQESGEKKRLKTNLDVHIHHVKDSGVIDAIRLLKLWKVRNGLRVKNFALELFTIVLLKYKKTAALENQLKHVWAKLRDEVGEISIEDPANPMGNDLSDLLSPAIRMGISSVAKRTLEIIEESGWKDIFGPVEEEKDANGSRKIEILRCAAAAVVTPTKPWADPL